MLLSDLITDLLAFEAKLPVLLASRPTGSDLAESEAQIVAFGEMLIDEAGSEVDIRPTRDGEGLNVEQVLRIAAARPDAASYIVSGIDNEVLLPDGRTVRSSTPVLGVLGAGNSVLLLLGLPEQWPTIQFQ